MRFFRTRAMHTKHRSLLAIDAVVNLLLGLALLLFPAGLIELLGLPSTRYHFYTSILGGVLIGIGLALLLEVLGEGRTVRGLGLAGAIAINLCGAGVLLYWLVSGHLEVSPRGALVLWVVVLAVLAIAAAELGALAAPTRQGTESPDRR